MKKKLSSIAGVTLIEILIGILISVVMMAAMFTSYTVVNNSYSQVADRAKISTAGRDVIGMLLRDIRLAGFKYFNDNIPTSNKHAPIIITKSSNFAQSCYKIEIVYGSLACKPTGNPLKYEYERYKITYECKKSKIPNKSATPLPGNKYPPIEVELIDGSKEYIYYKDSRLLQNLKNFPIIILSIIGAFIYLIYPDKFYYLNSNITI